jgi:hypothetical protein
MLFADLAQSLAAESGIELTLTTTDPRLQKTQPWVWLHPYGPKSQFSGEMWSWANMFVNFTSILELLSTRIAGLLGERCLVFLASQLLALPSQAAQGAEDILRAVAWACTKLAEEFSASPLVVNIKDLDFDNIVACLQVTSFKNNRLLSILSAVWQDIFAVIDWKAQSPVTVQVRSTVTDGLFLANKTYILFRLSGDIGRSLVNYITNHDALTLS